MNRFSPYSKILFSSDSFQDFFFPSSLILRSVIMVCLIVNFFGFSCLELIQLLESVGLYLWKKCWQFSAIFSSSTFLAPPPFFPLPGTPLTWMFRFLSPNGFLYSVFPFVFKFAKSYFSVFQFTSFFLCSFYSAIDPTPWALCLGYRIFFSCKNLIWFLEFLFLW